MLLVWSNHYETVVRSIFLKLCQKDNLCQSGETLKLLLIEINFYILWRTRINNFLKVMKLSQITVLKLRTIFLKLCQNNYMHENSTSFETGLTRYNVCNLIPQLPLYLRFSYSKHSNKKTCITSLWSHNKLNVLHFRAFNNVVLIQPVDTSKFEETFYFTAGFTFHQMFKSIARFVNTAIKQNPR